VIFAANVTNGQVSISIESATIACVPVPTQLLEAAAATLNQMIVESQSGVQVSSIKIDPGKVTVTGTKVAK
jgi:hypothetical protein